MLQLSRRTMFLWFHGAILPLLMLVSFNLENIVGLPIQTSKPNYKFPKERDTVEQKVWKVVINEEFLQEGTLLHLLESL